MTKTERARRWNLLYRQAGNRRYKRMVDRGFASEEISASMQAFWGRVDQRKAGRRTRKPMRAKIDQARRKRNQRLQRRYGMTVDQHDALLEDQRYTCAICAESFTEQRRPLVHCRRGVVCGLLCQHCLWLSSFIERGRGEEIVESALAYLHR